MIRLKKKKLFISLSKGLRIILSPSKRTHLLYPIRKSFYIDTDNNFLFVFLFIRCILVLFFLRRVLFALWFFLEQLIKFHRTVWFVKILQRHSIDTCIAHPCWVCWLGAITGKKNVFPIGGPNRACLGNPSAC